MALASVALDNSRLFLNDVAKQYWTDTILIPYLQDVHRELQDKLWTARAPTLIKTSAAIAVAAAALTLTLPADFLQPISMKEKASGGAITTYVDMTEYLNIPIEAQTATLRYWSWRGDAVVFLGSSANRDVQVVYRGLITLPTAAADQIGILLGELYLGPKTASIAAGAVGNTTLALELVALADQRLMQVVEANKGQHNLLATKRP